MRKRLAVREARYRVTRWGRRTDQVQSGIRVFVHGRQYAEARVHGHAVGFSSDVPLSEDVTAQRELDDRAVQIPIGARLSLRADTVLEAHEEFVAPLTDVIGVG